VSLVVWLSAQRAASIPYPPIKPWQLWWLNRLKKDGLKVENHNICISASKENLLSMQLKKAV